MPPLPAAARTLEKRIRNEIPLARAIDLHLEAFDGDTLTMRAPLAPNINDKGCAFGGSLASVMTMAGWALVVLALEARDLACEVYVGRSDIAYRAPVWGDFEAHAVLADGARWDTFFATLDAHAKARIRLHCRVTAVGSDAECATLEAAFVAKRPAGHAATSPSTAAQ